ncbi:hypothetical protein TA3x_003379 [Tundrisphaera sp. TA3]|uniref:hypothetical protein n=1 Tax=Tundrisphaera sp. TA3 TaxID=3435775 RepID=UPI003EBA3088
MNAASGALVGLFAGPMFLAIIGFVLGGIGRAAPCHSAPDFMSGALFGAFGFVFILGLPAMAVGAIAGGIWGQTLDHPVDRPGSNENA